MEGENTIIYVMGVSGSGKSTIGKALAEKLNLPFADGDDFHPRENIAKMRAGHPLNDQDRHGWLVAIHHYAQEQACHAGVVIACSALKEKYRELLEKELKAKVIWIYLRGDFELIRKRMIARQDHFMPDALLKSQFETLEEPSKAISVCIGRAPEEILSDIMEKLYQ